jgi:Rrf2 family protein
MLSTTAEYALRAVVYLARHEGEGPVQALELADATDVPLSYMRKVLHELGRAGILHSTRGKHGGFRLGSAPERISLLDVVSRFDRITDRRSCILGRTECSDRDPCPVHEHWKATSERVAAFFSGTTLADVVEDVVGGRSRRKKPRGP